MHITMSMELSTAMTKRDIVQHLIPEWPALTGQPPETTHPQNQGSLMMSNLSTKQGREDLKQQKNTPPIDPAQSELCCKRMQP